MGKGRLRYRDKSESQLLQLWNKTGDGKALEILLDKHLTIIISIQLDKGVPPMDAQERASDIILKVYNRLIATQERVGNMKGYLAKSTFRYTSAFHRKKKHHHQNLDDLYDLQNQYPEYDDEWDLLLQEAHKILDPEQKKIWDLHCLRNSDSETANLLGLNGVSVVSSRLSRIRKKLIQELKRLIDDQDAALL